MNPLDFRPRCSDCKEYLTLVEMHYYLHRCEKCEGRAHDELQRWKAGEKNEKFDKIFGE